MASSNYAREFAHNLPKHDCMSIVHNFHRMFNTAMPQYIEDCQAVFSSDSDKLQAIQKNSIWVMNVYLGGKNRTYAASTLDGLYEFAGNLEGREK